MVKAANLFRTYLVDSNPQEVLLADFLKTAGGAGKDRVVEALLAYYGSLALSRSTTASAAEIELAAIDAIAQLQKQIAHIATYHRLYDGIELSPATLNFGVVAATGRGAAPADDSSELSPQPEGYNLTIFDS